MRLDDLAPVLVGISQLEQRSDDPRTAREPLDLMIEAVRLAAEDAGAPSLLAGASSVRVIRGMWPYEDPGRVVADAIGNPRAETGVTVWGGNSVQSLLTDTALEIRRGERDIVILTGAECGNTQAKARRAGVELEWRKAPGEPDRRFGVQLKMRHRVEAQRGILDPMQMYAIFENAIRHARGESLPEHLHRVSELWAGFSRVAAENPHAWIRDALSAEEIRTPSAVNRAVSFPYPKFMNSNSNVDQAAALILTSTATARRLGFPRRSGSIPGRLRRATTRTRSRRGTTSTALRASASRDASAWPSPRSTSPTSTTWTSTAVSRPRCRWPRRNSASTRRSP